ncbi:6-phospho-beta-glucosidase [Clostridium septicum]|uniref:6-phospho-beta-glucosidase n=1 Tax=Clostridium septicum TaxID=1504 RepID=A0A9N7JLU2_CLOSE|nr:6-phospho-beta-glucosidase [Clostridium septicum]AYE34359.1 6-phospho-beta-glucosidase [Clostridium septicum]MDU1314320.1 6-phospho-beta-glucosidase [Clostridium septicum]QAS59765.1 6-phospho-beta-glucosidase [Clostridium septicum]UEC20999.1 6-phospho-beta-glucosidase [Clostridium septicum]USS00952.1 6-phospho-beta-glucosidase [Clostridium septicum]
MSKKGLKIVTIGGGSSYTPELVEGLIKRYGEMPVSEYWLVDIEEGKEKLEIVGALAKRMVEKAGVPMNIYLTLDRREALKDADFVTTQLRVGLLPARAKDERIPLSHGFLGQETNGAGGLFKALRTVPVILDIAKDIQELCPNAWLINFTNPAGIVTEALLRYGVHKKIIGVCNVPIGLHYSFAELLSVDSSRVTVDFAGLNHMVYAERVYLDGKNVTKEIIEKLTEPGGSVQTMANIKGYEWDAAFIKATGLIPCPYHRYYYKTRDMLSSELEEFKKGETRAEVVTRVEKRLFELYKDINLKEKPEELSKRGGAHYSDVACNVINSIYNDKNMIVAVNTKNNGVLKQFDNDSAIEVSCYIGKDGPKPIETITELPIFAQGLTSQIKAFERLAAEAAYTGDYNTALLAMTTNPLVADDKRGRALLNEMLLAHKKYLPQFKNVINQIEKVERAEF